MKRIDAGQELYMRYDWSTNTDSWWRGIHETLVMLDTLFRRIIQCIKIRY
jgi:hypothetical protein